MTRIQQRLVLLPLIEEALIGGARLQKACYQPAHRAEMAASGCL